MTPDTIDTSTAAPDIELSVPARPENIAVIRHAIGALSDVLGLDSRSVADIGLAVTEACTNIVVHAYPDGTTGPMEIATWTGPDAILIAVRDEGEGIAPRADSPGLGLGLPLIASLADAVELGHDDRNRTEVLMTFPLPTSGEDFRRARDAHGEDGSSAHSGDGSGALSPDED